MYQDIQESMPHKKSRDGFSHVLNMTLKGLQNWLYQPSLNSLSFRALRGDTRVVLGMTEKGQLKPKENFYEY